MTRWCIFVLTFSLFGQQPDDVAQAREADSYQIYSILLKTEMPPQWKITSWTIERETRTFFSGGGMFTADPATCLTLTRDQAPVYRPLLDEYVVRNKKPTTLEPKFDLVSYTLVDRNARSAARGVLFHVSAVGFNHDGTRALVYVGHICGSLCGGGQYHFMVKKDDTWKPDEEFHGGYCLWAS